MTRTDITTARSGSENPVGHEVAYSARIGVHLRRQRRAGAQLLSSRLNFPGLVIDLGRHQVLRDGDKVALTPTEFNLLPLLASRPGRVVSRVELTKRVWGEGAELDPRSIDAHIYRLRRKLEPRHDHPTCLHAVPGVGYRFDHRPAVGLMGRRFRRYAQRPSPVEVVSPHLAPRPSARERGVTRRVLPGRAPVSSAHHRAPHHHIGDHQPGTAGERGA
jgi:DNA-binding winged helix-turn-helix (wHTH) protein